MARQELLDRHHYWARRFNEERLKWKRLEDRYENERYEPRCRAGAHGAPVCRRPSDGWAATADDGDHPKEDVWGLLMLQDARDFFRYVAEGNDRDSIDLFNELKERGRARQFKSGDQVAQMEVRSDDGDDHRWICLTRKPSAASRANDKPTPRRSKPKDELARLQENVNKAVDAALKDLDDSEYGQNSLLDARQLDPGRMALAGGWRSQVTHVRRGGKLLAAGSTLKAAPERGAADLRRPLHDDETRALKVRDRALRHDLRHDLVGVVDTLRPLEPERKGERGREVLRICGLEGFSGVPGIR